MFYLSTHSLQISNPGPSPLNFGRKSDNVGIAVSASYDLQPYRQPIGGETRRDRNGRMTAKIDGMSKTPPNCRLGGFPRDTRWPSSRAIGLINNR